METLHIPKPFEQLCDELRCDIHEREQLAYRLAAFRMEATLRALLPIAVDFTLNRGGS